MICPVEGLIRPIALVLPLSVNHKFPSGPGAIPAGSLPGFRPDENSVIRPAGSATAIGDPNHAATNTKHHKRRTRTPPRRYGHPRIARNLTGQPLPMSNQPPQPSPRLAARHSCNPCAAGPSAAAS